MFFCSGDERREGCEDADRLDFFLEMTDKMPFFVFSWHNPLSGLLVKKWDFLRAKMLHTRL